MKILFVFLALFLAQNANAQTIADSKTVLKGRPNKTPAYNTVSLFTCDESSEFLLSYVAGAAPFTYYIYDESGLPVTFGNAQFDEQGQCIISLEGIPNGYYTVEVVVNGSTYTCSFCK